jgi:hypothetical protein
MKSSIACVIFSVVCGCGGSEFAKMDISMGVDAAPEASEVDTQNPTPRSDAGGYDAPIGNDSGADAGADMQAEGEASTPFEASTDAGPTSPDASEGGSDDGGVPSCGDDEVYPRLSHTCQEYIKTTQWPLYVGCCKSDHTCGMVMGAVGMMTCRSFPQ